MNTLSDERRKWEKGGIEIAHFVKAGRVDECFSVIGRKPESFDLLEPTSADTPIYSLYRYFKIGTSWVTSVDENAIEAGAMMQALANVAADEWSAG